MQEQYEYDFKRISIPKDIWEYRGLSPTDKCLWAQIAHLEKKEEGCFATAEYFAIFLEVNIATINRSLKKLADWDLIYQDGFKNHRRIWRSSIKTIRIPDSCRFLETQNASVETQNASVETPPTGSVNINSTDSSHSPIYIDNTSKRKTKEKDILSGKPDGEPISFEIGSRVIVKLLNILAETHFREDAKGTRTLIAARVKDGATLLDFEKVIKIKVEQWADDEKMVGYLRPETLFARNHFESYRNEYEVKYDRD